MSFTSDIKKEIMNLAEELDEKKAFLREVFLLTGSIIDPEKEYHLEILTDEDFEEILPEDDSPIDVIKDRE